MDTSIEELEAIGKQAFEHCFQAGLFFFPKVLYRTVGGELVLAQYETEFEQFRFLCMLVAEAGPLEFIAHTADTYYFNAEADPEMTKRIQAGETSASEQFEQENPNSSEALVIIIMDAECHTQQRVLPYVRQGKTLHWSEPRVLPEGLQAAGRYAEVMADAIKASYDAQGENAGG
jgi:hypothetical protein